MKLVKVSENRILDASNGHQWDYSKTNKKLSFYGDGGNLDISLYGEEAEIMWDWLLDNLEN